MVTLRETDANLKMIGQLKHTLSELISQTLQRGFHGTAEIRLKVHDGTIQEIRRAVERVER
jgi:hypothetical protein